MTRGVTEAEVFEASDRLLSRGERPTIERVRGELGRGSPNTVNRHLDAWWASLAERIRQSTNGAIPASLIELCGRLYGGLRAEASRDAERVAEGLQAERRRLEQMAQALLAEKEGVATTVRELRSDLSVVHQRVVQAQEQIRTLDRELAGEKQTAAQASQAARVAIEERQRSEKVLKDELQRTREQAGAHEKRWLAEIDRLREEVKRRRGEAAALNKVQTATLEALQEKLQNADESVASLNREVAKSREQLAEQREARIAAEAALGALKAPRPHVSRGKVGGRGRPRSTRKPVLG